MAAAPLRPADATNLRAIGPSRVSAALSIYRAVLLRTEMVRQLAERASATISKASARAQTNASSGAPQLNILLVTPNNNHR
jgi:hypothetical protein